MVFLRRFCQVSVIAVLSLAPSISHAISSVTDQQSKDEKAIALPLTFEQNRGQLGGQALYLSHSQDGLIVFTGNQVMLPCIDKEVGLTIHGDGRNFKPTAERPTRGVANYYKGNNPAEWIESIPLEGQVRYKHVAAGVDLVFHGRDGRLEYDVEVAPGADPAAISLSADSESRFSIQPDGSAVPVSADGKTCEGLQMHPPVAYQMIDGRRVAVTARFALDNAGRLGFSVHDYAHDLPLTIDPVVAYTKIIGVNNATSVAALAVDAGGNVYLTGSTSATNYPVVGGSGSIGLSGSQQVYLTKLDPTGSQVLFSTYSSCGGLQFCIGDYGG